ncbi:hypothetical protein OG985_26050 [Streptomyces sp. NBC_00289]
MTAQVAGADIGAGPAIVIEVTAVDGLRLWAPVGEVRPATRPSRG